MTVFSVLYIRTNPMHMCINGTYDPQMCLKKAISYKCPYVIAIVVPYHIYTVVMMTICANQENNIVLGMEY